MQRSDFPADFSFGVSTAAYQVEGSHNCDGKGPSIWDDFSLRNRRRWKGDSGDVACDFYNLYEKDLSLLAGLGIKNFRTSIAWSRVLPQGKGPVNEAGLDFYDRLVDTCLELGITPWLTLYHWDLPLAIEQEGGWKNRSVLGYFKDFCRLAANRLGDRVKNWMVMNEPMVFTGAGYFLGFHAPGKRGFSNFLPAVHHATLAMGAGGRVLRAELPSSAQIGTTFSQSWIEPVTKAQRHQNAAARADSVLNRLFIEPILGLGYPLEHIPVMRRMEKHILQGDEQLLPFDFDFLGLQLYTREVVEYSLLTPYAHARLVHPMKRAVPHTVMGWEVYPDAMYLMLKRWHDRYKIKKIIVTENGAAFPDTLINGRVHDTNRKEYLEAHIERVRKAVEEGMPVKGYFAWTFIDNFEWAHRFEPRFGIVYTDYSTQNRYVKDSGLWYSKFLNELQEKVVIDKVS